MSFGPKPWKDKPDGTTPISAAGLMDMEGRLAAYTDAEIAVLVVAEVDTLPGSPVEGQEVDFYPSGVIGTGVCWRCVWRGSLHSGAGAWAARGPSLISRVVTAEATSSSTYGGLTTSGPSVVLPAGGLYRVQVGSFIRGTAAAAVNALHSFVVTGGAPSDDDAAQRIGSTNGDGAGCVGPVVEVTVAAAGDGIASRYRSANSNSATFSRRWISVTPVELRP